MKKVLALVLAVMMVVSIAPMTFAADSFSIGVSGNAAQLSSVDLYGANVGDSIAPNSTFKFYPYVNGALITKKAFKDNKLDIKTQISAGSKGIRDITVQYEKIGGVEYAYIRIRTVEFFVSTGDLDIEFAVYLTKDKSRIDGTKVEFAGNIANLKQEAYEDDDYVYVYDVPVVEAKDYIKSIEVELGNGVSIFAKMFAGKKYYGQASNKVKSEDDSVLSQYPDIDTVYYLQTIGLNSSGNYVKLDISDKLFVYNADLEPIGTTADKLPYSTKYYVSSKELDVASDAAEPTDGDGDASEPAVNPPMGGDDVPENVNDNPGTGC